VDWRKSATERDRAFCLGSGVVRMYTSGLMATGLWAVCSLLQFASCEALPHLPTGSMTLTLTQSLKVIAANQTKTKPSGTSSSPRPPTPKENPLLVAHRGDSIAYPENTMEAFVSAYRKGADVLECDVYLSSDGVVMIIHDATVTRTTEAMGRVDSYTYDELRQLDAGYRFTRDGGATFPFRGQGVQIPSMREALMALPDAIFNIDMKEGEPMARPLAHLVEELGCQDRVQIATTRTDGGGMDTFRELQPTVKMVATVGETLAFAALFVVGLPDAHTPIGFEYQVPVIAGLSDTPELIRAANALGQTVQHWTINDGAEMVRLLDIGSDGIMTDDVSLGMEVFAPYRPPPVHGSVQ
jgi:glycerophosphoryl diester phosphodiesterase